MGAAAMAAEASTRPGMLARMDARRRRSRFFSPSERNAFAMAICTLMRFKVRFQSILPGVMAPRRCAVRISAKIGSDRRLAMGGQSRVSTNNHEAWPTKHT